MKSRKTSRYVALALMAAVISGTALADRGDPGPGRHPTRGDHRDRNDRHRTPSWNRGVTHTPQPGPRVVIPPAPRGCGPVGPEIFTVRLPEREPSHGHEVRAEHHGYREDPRSGYRADACVHFAGGDKLVVRRLSSHCRIVQPRIHGHGAVMQIRARSGHAWITLSAHLPIW